MNDLKTTSTDTTESMHETTSVLYLATTVFRGLRHRFVSHIMHSVSFLSNLIHTGGKRPLVLDDLGENDANIKSANLYSRFEKEWKKEFMKKPKHRSFMGAIFRATGTYYWVIIMVLNLLTVCLQFVPTIILNLFLKDLESETSNANKRWIYSVMLLLLPLINALLISAMQMTTVKVAVTMKMMASEAIYCKALKLTSSSKGSTSTGQLVNLMSTDTNTLLMFTMVVTVVVMIPIMMVICIVMVAMQMGQLTWVALAIYVVMLICQFITVRCSMPIRVKNLKATDARVKLMNEILTGIRVIKYYCWEKPFKQKIRDIRKSEVFLIQKMGWLMSIGIDCFMTLVPNIVPLVCFSLYYKVIGQPLTSSVAFTSLSLFKMLQMPFSMMPMCMMMFVQFNVSIKRITNFLNLEEVSETIVEKNLPEGSTVLYKDIKGDNRVLADYDAAGDAILIRDGYFAWGDGDNCLKDISVRIPKGSLVAVVGRVGSGKTSFVSSLVGEMTKNAGVVLVNGSMSFSAQQAWLVNDTVRNNILFGKAYDEAKYKEVLKVCCLEDDLKVLAGGDQCEIGERGINVSGGQKARISLARCCYSDSDIVIMDDPIAAVDSHVGKALFHSCIAKYMDGHTRILVTNATQYLHKCDYIIVLENNIISHQGTYAELKAANIDFMTLLTEEEASSVASDKSEPEKENTDKKQSTMRTTTVSEESGTLTKEESKITGKMSWSVYAYFFQAFGWFLLIVIVVCIVAATVFSILSQFKLSEWSEDTSCENDVKNCTVITNGFIKQYFILILSYSVLTIIRILLVIPGRVIASQKIHDNLADVVLDAPISFHDITPVGRVLNRFNNDMSTLDHNLPHSMSMLISQVFLLVAECVNIVVSTKGWMLIIIVIAFVVYYYVQKSFRKSNTDIQRIESLTRSPIFTDFQGVLFGSPSIRAYGHQQRFIDGMEAKLDKNSRAMMIFHWASAWLSVRSDCISSFISFFIAVIANVSTGFLSPGLVGIALSSSSGLNANLKQMVKILAQTEAQMNCVERIKEYVDTVKPEPPMITDVRPPPNWPSEGRIVMNDAKLRYRDGPLVMKGVNLEIEGHEKVGVVGRTGAGKSTMMIALFRITDLCGGSVTIDGIDLATLGLEDVRRALCIIPQDPVLFSASVRFNLDPFNESSDEEIWSVLEQVELKDSILALPNGIDSDVQEGGSNFSVGERQLICMARALLRKPKILIMDEATASLDNETDTFLQQMIRKQFEHCTSLTIAHRLNTIMDADRVCVMDQGIVAEYDTPYNLLRKDGSIFQGMVVAANDPSLFDMVPGCDDMKCLLKEKDITP